MKKIIDGTVRRRYISYDLYVMDIVSSDSKRDDLLESALEDIEHKKVQITIEDL